MPKLVASLQGQQVVQVSAGDFHSLALVRGGDVYSFGAGSFGRLGHGNQLNQLLPKLIAALQGTRVVQVSAGQMHSLALAEGGEVYSFGRGRHGQLGHGDVEDQLVPTLIPATATRQGRVVEVAAGARWSLLLQEDGEVASLGSGRAEPREGDGGWLDGMLDGLAEGLARWRSFNVQPQLSRLGDVVTNSLSRQAY